MALSLHLPDIPVKDKPALAIHAGTAVGLVIMT
jgi:hypothetical protein